MSVKLSKAEVARRWWHFRYVPLAEFAGETPVSPHITKSVHSRSGDCFVDELEPAAVAESIFNTSRNSCGFFANIILALVVAVLISALIYFFCAFPTARDQYDRQGSKA